MPNFVLAATFTLAVGLVLQAALLTLYLLLRDRAVLRAIARAWRPSLFAGFMGAIASQFWFLAFALDHAPPTCARSRWSRCCSRRRSRSSSSSRRPRARGARHVC